MKPVEKEIEVSLKFPEVEPLNPPVLTLNEIQFRYSNDKVIFNSVNLSANLDSRICIVSRPAFQQHMQTHHFHSYFHEHFDVRPSGL